VLSPVLAVSLAFVVSTMLPVIVRDRRGRVQIGWPGPCRPCFARSAS
jgi:hypothetical protein